jgi:hypothetical protein
MRAGWKSQTKIKKPDRDAKSAAALSAFLPNTSSPGSKKARALPPGPGVEMLASDASTNETWGQNSDSKKPSKTTCFQGLDVWLRGHATISNCCSRQLHKEERPS